LPLDLEGIAPPVDQRFGFFDFCCIGDAFRGLRYWGQRSPAISVECLQYGRGANSRQPIMKRAARVRSRNGDLLFQKHRSRVQSHVHQHDCHAADGIACLNGPLNGRGPAPAGQKRGVNVQTSKPRKGQRGAREDQTVGHNDERVGLPGRQVSSPGLVLERLRLGYREAVGERRFFDGTCRDLPASTFWSIRLREHPDNGMGGADQRQEGRNGEIRCSSKCDTHVEPSGA